MRKTVWQASSLPYSFFTERFIFFSIKVSVFNAHFYYGYPHFYYGSKHTFITVGNTGKGEVVENFVENFFPRTHTFFTANAHFTIDASVSLAYNDPAMFCFWGAIH